MSDMYTQSICRNIGDIQKAIRSLIPSGGSFDRLKILKFAGELYEQYQKVQYPGSTVKYPSFQNDFQAVKEVWMDRNCGPDAVAKLEGAYCHYHQHWKSYVQTKNP